MILITKKYTCVVLLCFTIVVSLTHTPHLHYNGVPISLFIPTSYTFQINGLLNRFENSNHLTLQLLKTDI